MQCKNHCVVIFHALSSVSVTGESWILDISGYKYAEVETGKPRKENGCHQILAVISRILRRCLFGHAWFVHSSLEAYNFTNSRCFWSGPYQYSMYNFHLRYCFGWHQTAAVKDSYLNTWMFEWYPQPCGEWPNVYAALYAATIVCKGGTDKVN